MGRCRYAAQVEAHEVDLGADARTSEMPRRSHPAVLVVGEQPDNRLANEFKSDLSFRGAS
jgi:hypothetical protein